MQRVGKFYWIGRAFNKSSLLNTSKPSTPISWLPILLLLLLLNYHQGEIPRQLFRHHHHRPHHLRYHYHHHHRPPPLHRYLLLCLPSLMTPCALASTHCPL